jgi:sugar lactone lactonase YvrE
MHYDHPDQVHCRLLTRRGAITLKAVEHILSIRCELGEGPIWHPEQEKLYWVDILANTIHTYHPDSKTHHSMVFPDHICAMGIRKKGGMVLATRKHFAFWDGASGNLEFIEEIEADKGANRFNDGAVDRLGCFWAGTISPGEANGQLYRLNPDLTVDAMIRGVRTSNGLGWSPDNRTMYFTDSPLKTIFAYDFDPETGAISNRRPHIHTPDEPGVPDGLTVDREGCIWSARWDGYRITRYTPDGEEDRVVEMPVARPTSIAFGGPDLRELFITTAWMGYSPSRIQEEPQAGDLFSVKVDVPGFPEPVFLG